MCMTEINHLDLAFVVDTTGSMSGLIAAAQQQMIAMIDELSRAAAVDMRLAVVEYRDHPPQDQLVVRVHGFTGELRKAQKAIRGLAAQGGGDGPESVLDGVLAACRDLAWRPRSRRLAVLVGDAPPHGVGAAGDGFPGGCPCGETIESVTAAAERARVTLYALGLNGSVTDAFERLSRATGGEFFPAGHGDAAIARLKNILVGEFGNLEFDRRVLAERQRDAELSASALAERLASTRGAVAAAISRLERRELLV
jgi:Mg-chelatase subunit ChlD